MDRSDNQGSLPKYQLSKVSNDVLILGCITSAAITIILDCIFGWTIHNVSFFHLGVAVVLAAGLILLQMLKLTHSHHGSLVAYLYFHLMFYYVLIFVIPQPSIYFMLVIGPAVIGYYSFGIRSVILSALSSCAVFLGQFVARGNLDQANLGAFIVSTVVMAIILVYVVIFLKVADDEQKALKTVTRQIELERSRLSTLVNNLNDERRCQ